jgi:hypothetical protein
MLVSAAMAERPRAAPSGGSRLQPPPAQTPRPAARHSTARVSTTQGVRRTELPGWFWGALGCLTVLVVGLSIVFLMGQGGSPPPPPAAVVKTVETAVPPPARPGPGTAADPAARAPAIKIEPMAAPQQAVGEAAAHPAVAKPRPATRPIKVARSPASAAKPSGAAKPPADDSSDDDTEDEEPKARPRAAAEDEAGDR